MKILQKHKINIDIFKFEGVLFIGVINMNLMTYQKDLDYLLNDYHLPEEQAQYSALPRMAVEISENDSNRHPLMGIVDHHLVTFFILEEGEAAKIFSADDRDILLRSFSTNYENQGKGYARKALELTPDYIRKNLPHINGIVLGVNKKNVAAQKLYEKCGFIDEGNRVMGSKGEMIVMKYYL